MNEVSHGKKSLVSGISSDHSQEPDLWHWRSIPYLMHQVW